MVFFFGYSLPRGRESDSIFSPNPSLTSATTSPDWEGTYPGLMDQFHFCDKAINAEDVRRLSNEKG
ncbi:hypothetical protein H8744_06980 [Oscillospiraceae bacterium N12]|uniref:Uncharacterized protein n=1 Tax=Jilunia laotingensis TaxID=2763675 RepID=A0A926F428_9BACT|nr:hypothetical protein [Jilunia laotingensis]MBC8593001.1 hypothetical protein [Jilunia laotingensis]